MLRMMTAFALLATASTASAHWVWVVPDAADPAKAIVVFGHALEPDDNPKILDKIAGAKLWIRAAGGDKPVEWKRGEKAFELTRPGPGATVGGVNHYGVVQKGEAKPFLLIQCPKLAGTDATPWDKLPLEILPGGEASKPTARVVFRGKPAPAGLEVVVHTADGETAAKVKTDDKGAVAFAPPATPMYGLTTAHSVPESGEHGGKKYEEVRYSASVVVPAAKPAKTSAVGERSADPEAMRVFEAARAARAHWVGFPGFTADVVAEADGQVGRGTVTVGADYKFALTGLDGAVAEAARKELTSVVGHRKDTSKEPTPPVVFDDAAGDSAAGRAIRVLGDKADSVYRVRDNQLVVTQRTMPTQRFSILALENVKNAEGKLLPASHVVQYWDNKTGDLVKSDANFHTWVRVGAFDLPATCLKMTTVPNQPAAQAGPKAVRLTLTNHKLAAQP